MSSSTPLRRQMHQKNSLLSRFPASVRLNNDFEGFQSFLKCIKGLCFYFVNFL